MTSFPLLRLPRLALIEVLKEMGTMELLELAQISTKLSHVVRNNSPNKFTVALIASTSSRFFNLSLQNEPMTIEIVPNQNYGKERTVFWRVENQNISTIKLDAVTIYALFDDLPLGQIVIGQYLIRLFKCSINTVILVNLPLEELEPLAELLSNQEVQRLIIDFDNTENAQFILDKVKIVKELELVSKHKTEFPPLTLRNGPKNFKIDYSSWVTMETLKGLSFENLWLSESCFTNEDLDLFVTLWKKRNFPNLKHIYVISNRINNQETIGGMMPPILNKMERHDAVCMYSFGTTVSIGGGVEIRRDDDVKAKMFVKTHSIYKSFSLFVCD